MSERTGQRTLTQILNESRVWAERGFMDAGTLEAYAHSRTGDPQHARDIGQYAMRGLLSTPTYLKAMHDAEPDQLAAHHAFSTLEIYQKSWTDGRPTLGMTQEEFLNQGGEPWWLLDADQWLVSTESLHDLYYRIQVDAKRFDQPIRAGLSELEHFGTNEEQVIRLAVLLGSTARRAA